jgi:hypothetical protein
MTFSLDHQCIAFCSQQQSATNWWLPLSGATLGLVAAFIGGFITLRANRDSIASQLLVAREQIDQSRFSQAYVTLQRYISGWADHAAYNSASFHLNTDVEPTIPSFDEFENATASLFASDEVLSQISTFGKEVTAYRIAIGARESQEDAAAGSVPNAGSLKIARDEVVNRAKKVVALAESVHKIMRNEIQGLRARRG